MITTHDFFAAIRRAAPGSSMRPDALTGLSRRVHYSAQAGDGIAPETAEIIIAVARKLISPEVIELIDGAGRRHIAADYVDRAKAQLAQLTEQLCAKDAELTLLRRVVLTRCKVSSL